MKHRKSQISSFIITPIILLVLVSFLLTPDYSAKQQPEQGTAKNVMLFIENCLTETLKTGNHAIAEQGGYYRLPEGDADTEINVPIYYYTGNENIPAIETIEKELSAYIEEHLISCLNNFQKFNEEINTGDIHATTIITENEVRARIQFPVEIRKQKQSINRDAFIATRPSKIKQLHHVSAAIVKTVKNHAGLCLDCIKEISDTNNITIHTIRTKENEILYTLNNSELTFRFAIKI